MTLPADFLESDDRLDQLMVDGKMHCAGMMEAVVKGDLYLWFVFGRQMDVRVYITAKNSVPFIMRLTNAPVCTSKLVDKGPQSWRTPLLNGI